MTCTSTSSRSNRPGRVDPVRRDPCDEHGLYVLEGKAVYRLNEDWVEVRRASLAAVLSARRSTVWTDIAGRVVVLHRLDAPGQGCPHPTKPKDLERSGEDEAPSGLRFELV